MNTVKCAQCGLEIQIDKALEGEIEQRILADARKQHQAELQKLQSDLSLESERRQKAAQEAAQKQLLQEKELLELQNKAELEMARKKLEHEVETAKRKFASDNELAVQRIKEDAESEKEANKQLREQISGLMLELRAEKQAKNNALLDAQKKVAAEEAKIREETSKQADERYRLKLAEQEKQLADTKKALEDAQRKAAQGSQQNQGEVLELDLENRLRSEFPFDTIDEVKKGVRGADLKQTVCNPGGSQCGILLWETKNGKWQPAWIAKFKADIREANANIGVLVSQELPADVHGFRQLEANLWVCSPQYAARLAVALRSIILQVEAANRMNAGKDSKMEALYQFLVGPEFRHRVEAIVENYSVLQAEIEKEKRAAALRWAHQEKAIRNVIDNTIGMYGDLQGITNRALPSIKTLEYGDFGEDDETASPLTLL